MKSELNFLNEIYLALQIAVTRKIKEGSHTMAIDTDSIRASLRNRITLLSGQDGQIIQENCESKAWDAIPNKTEKRL